MTRRAASIFIAAMQGDAGETHGRGKGNKIRLQLNESNKKKKDWAAHTIWYLSGKMNRSITNESISRFGWKIKKANVRRTNRETWHWLKSDTGSLMTPFTSLSIQASAIAREQKAILLSERTCKCMIRMCYRGWCFLKTLIVLPTYPF